jgi:hypothetical protein
MQGLQCKFQVSETIGTKDIFRRREYSTAQYGALIDSSGSRLPSPLPITDQAQRETTHLVTSYSVHSSNHEYQRHSPQLLHLHHPSPPSSSLHMGILSRQPSRLPTVPKPHCPLPRSQARRTDEMVRVLFRGGGAGAVYFSYSEAA